jgi:hypothetical protein
VPALRAWDVCGGVGGAPACSVPVAAVTAWPGLAFTGGANTLFGRDVMRASLRVLPRAYSATHEASMRNVALATAFVGGVLVLFLTGMMFYATSKKTKPVMDELPKQMPSAESQEVDQDQQSHRSIPPAQLEDKRGIFPKNEEVLASARPDFAAQAPAAQPSGAQRGSSLSGSWLNPVLKTTLAVKRDSWTEQPVAGGPQIAGKLRFVPNGLVVLDNPGNGKSFFIRLGQDVIACQEMLPDTTKVGDGFVRFREGYDWQGVAAQQVQANNGHVQSLAGRWTHPNSDFIYEADRNRRWTKHRKKGGVEATGAWQPLSDGSFTARLDNRNAARIWPIGDDFLAIVCLDEQNSMQSDGVVVQRERKP